MMLLENLRFHKEEEANDPRFAKKLAALCDLYINDAFGASHRAHASVVGLPSLVKEKGVGFLMKREIDFFGALLKNPKKPFVALLGGSKVSDKIGVIESLLGMVDVLCIGGAMAYTFLKAQGKSVGDSKVEGDKIHLAKKILERAANKGVLVLLPKDHRMAQSLKEDAVTETTANGTIPAGWMGVDIGPKTVEAFGEALQKAKTVFWNGPMGIYEIEKFSLGTYSLAQRLGSLKATTVVGGGDSTAAVQKAKGADQITHLSTGGGASLEFIEAGTLPGLKVLGYEG